MSAVWQFYFANTYIQPIVAYFHFFSNGISITARNRLLVIVPRPCYTHKDIYSMCFLHILKEEVIYECYK